jgi:SAM-dependent methyltransferase
MPPFGDRYALNPGATDHERLRMLCEIHDPFSRELLLRAGLGRTHRYVEFGCGLGYVTRWAAAQASHALGTDLSVEHLDEARRLAEASGLLNVDFEHANIYEHGLPAESFDYSYCRWLLDHLQRPVDAIRTVAKALKPGGIFVCEEADLSEIYAEPACSAYERMRDIVVAAARQRGVDFEGGRRAHLWAEEAGFEVLHVSAYQPHYLTGPFKRFWSWTMLAQGPALIAEGATSEDELKELEVGMRTADENPHVLVGHSRTHQVIARKKR